MYIKYLFWQCGLKVATMIISFGRSITEIGYNIRNKSASLYREEFDSYKKE